MIQSAYVHIPFCETICSYCDFCKMFYHKPWIMPYFHSLKEEIIENYRGEELSTLYVGGGTPSVLSLEELKELLGILKKFQLSEDYEYTFECNIENITYEKLKLLKEYGVNRLSIGIQTLNEKLLKILERNHRKEEVFEKIAWLKELGFSNINVDFMYALPKETLEDVKKDLEEFLKLDLPHISLYSLILEPHTKLYLKEKPIDEDLDYAMYQMIETILESHGYHHYETSNYSKKGYESKHNLTYWKNLEYYGFGLGASGYVNGIRYENTRNLDAYLEGRRILESHKLSELENMQNEMILGLRKLEGVSKERFLKKYGKKIEEVFNLEEILKSGKLIFEDGYYKIPKEYQYLANEVLIYFI